jgi:hypothetical protein
MLDGFIFGFVDNAVLILGAFTGFEIERFFKGSGVRGTIFGAAIGNTISDAVGALLDPSIQPLLLGIVIGTLVPILFIPIVERMMRINK